MNTKICIECKVNQTLDNYYKSGFTKYKIQKYKGRCKSCYREKYVVSGRDKIKNIAISIFGNYSCSICKYDKCDSAIHFHHLDPKTKLFQVSNMHSYSYVDIEKEIKKCILLCANCHAEMHENLRAK